MTPTDCQSEPRRSPDRAVSRPGITKPGAGVGCGADCASCAEVFKVTFVFQPRVFRSFLHDFGALRGHAFVLRLCLDFVEREPAAAAARSVALPAG
jgi:hypothetical protein